MDTTLTPNPVPTFADLIPADVLAKAARLAFDTLVSILSDAKAAANERRIAALAILRLTFPAKRSERARSASEGQTPRPAPPIARPPDAPDVPPLAHTPLTPRSTPRATPARHITALAGASPVTSSPTPPAHLTG